MKRSFLQFLLAAALCVALSAAASATMYIPAINGTCIDEQGQPCAHATLKFFDPVGGKRFTLVTDSQGKFYHPAAEPADYNVTVQRAGQADVELPVAGVTFSVLPLIATIDLRHGTIHMGRQTLTLESFDVHGPVSIGSESAIVDPFTKDVQADFESGNWDSAIRRLTRALERDPKNADLHAMLGYAHYELAKKDPANAEPHMKACVDEYNTAITLKPAPRFYNNLGAAYVKAHRYDDGIQQFKTAEGLLPVSKNLYERNIGVTLVGQSYELPEAESIVALQRASDTFTGVLNAEPDNADVLYWKGVALLRLAGTKPGNANYDEVTAIFRRYLQVAPNGRFAKDVNGMLASIQSMPRSQNR